MLRMLCLLCSSNIFFSSPGDYHLRKSVRTEKNADNEYEEMDLFYILSYSLTKSAFQCVIPQEPLGRDGNHCWLLLKPEESNAAKIKIVSLSCLASRFSNVTTVVVIVS